MAKKLAIVNRLVRMVDESSSPVIYEEIISVVASGASGENQVNEADAEKDDTITLPGSQTYEGLELEVYVNKIRLTYNKDYYYVGTGSKTQIAFNYNLYTGQTIKFRIDRSA